jgi:hypothetical protein
MCWIRLSGSKVRYKSTYQKGGLLQIKFPTSHVACDHRGCLVFHQANTPSLKILKPAPPTLSPEPKKIKINPWTQHPYTPTPHTPTPYTPTPYALHPTPYTLHSTTQTLTFKPRIKHTKTETRNSDPPHSDRVRGGRVSFGKGGCPRGHRGLGRWPTPRQNAAFA